MTDMTEHPDKKSAPVQTPEELGKGEHFEETWQPRLWSKVLVLVILVGCLLGIVIANSDKVELDLLLTSVRVSKVWLIAVCFVIGFLSGVLASQLYRRRRARTKR